MPSIPLRRRLLEELDDLDRSVKRARIERYLEDLQVTDDIPSLSSDSESDRSNSSLSSLSGLSSTSDATTSDGASTSNPDTSSNCSDISFSISELEDYWYSVFDAELNALREEILTTRVLMPNPPIKKIPQIQLLDEWRKGNPDQYRSKVRVDPATFDGILAKIDHHPIFHNGSNSVQTPIATQLAVFLFRAGHYGNAATPEAIGHWAGMSSGSVVNCTNRILVALLALHDEYVRLPTEHEKEHAKNWVAAQVCPEWRNGFLMADGTKFPLFQRPGLHGDTWFDKNKNYSMDCQLVILPDSLQIVDYALGHTGSVHDSWAFRSTRAFKEHETIFADGEWMWADSAYPAELWSVSPFKKPVGGELTPNQRTFNYHVSKVRIRAEHAIGLLKGRFQALRELQIQIDTQKRHRWAVLFVRCCIILHNLIIRLEGDDYDTDFREELLEQGQDYGPAYESDNTDGDDEVRRARQRVETVGHRFRRQIMERLFSSPTSGAVRR